MIARFLVALCVALAFCCAAQAQGTTIPHTCSQAIEVTQGGAGTTALVGPDTLHSVSAPTAAQLKIGAGNSILICGYVVNSVTGGTAALEYGTLTSAACDTGTTPITPAWGLPANGTVADNGDYFRGLSVPPGQTLCLVSTGAAASVIVYFDNLPL